jgi:mannose-6-phosphate isomerase-like protein (cupin superfamily)
MTLRRIAEQVPFTTKDGSTIRSILDLSNAPVRNQSLAEATVPAGVATERHYHRVSEEFYFVLEGTGRMRVGDHTLTVPRHGGVLVAPDQLRQVFNDTDHDALWLIVGAPEELEFLRGSQSETDLSLFYPTDPTQLPKELAGTTWPPREDKRAEQSGG